MIEKMVRLTQDQLKEFLVNEMAKRGYNPIIKDGFIYCKGSAPILFVAHMDTVHREQVKFICFSQCGNIVMSPQGIGGDDRAGIYMILEIIKTHNVSVLFTEDEEIGGVGADKFMGYCLERDYTPDVNFIIQLDRRGDNDAVFYDCDNPEFTAFIESFGFVEAQGSFSDISVIAPMLGIAAVNLSAGFFNEHSLHEYIDLEVCHLNIMRINSMVGCTSEKFEYVEYEWVYEDEFISCASCDKDVLFSQTVAISIFHEYVCYECLSTINESDNEYATCVYCGQNEMLIDDVKLFNDAVCEVCWLEANGLADKTKI